MTTQNGAEAALRTERDFISAIFETISALVVVLDREGRIRFFTMADTVRFDAKLVHVRRAMDELLAEEKAP